MTAHASKTTVTAVPLLDVARSNADLRDEILTAIASVLNSGRFLHGPDVAQLEREIAEYCGVEHAVACASGSDALLLALMVRGIGPGDEVIVPSFTFFATASCVWRLGARPVFVDIDPVSFNIDPEKTAEAVTPATKAVIPVHLFGQCAAMDRVASLAERHGLFVIEDACQAIGARLQGRSAGAWGHVGCFSFYPTKNLGGLGDGGMLTTNDSELAQQLRLYAAHGMQPRYYHRVVGINSRLDTVQAAALRVKLRHLERWSAARAVHAAHYRQLFTAASLHVRLLLPPTGPGYRHVWNQYTVRVPGGQRDALRAHLAQLGIGTEIYYPVPLHRQSCFQSLGYAEASLPETERAAAEVLSLPVFPELRREEQERVVEAIAEFFGASQRAAA